AYFLMEVPASLRAASRVVCVTAATADAVAKYAPWARAKMRVIHHGVTPSFRVMSDRDRVGRECERLTGGPGPFWLCVGGLSPNKNHRRMLEAFALAHANDRTRLVIVSRLGKPEALRQRASELGVGERLVL